MHRFVYRLMIAYLECQFDKNMAKCNSYFDKNDADNGSIYLAKAKRWHEVHKALVHARYGLTD